MKGDSTFVYGGQSYVPSSKQTSPQFYWLPIVPQLFQRGLARERRRRRRAKKQREGGEEKRKERGKSEGRRQLVAFKKQLISGLPVMTNLRLLPHSQVFQPQRHLQTVTTAQNWETVKSKSWAGLPSPHLAAWFICFFLSLWSVTSRCQSFRTKDIFKTSTGNKSSLYGCVCQRRRDKEMDKVHWSFQIAILGMGVWEWGCCCES